MSLCALGRMDGAAGTHDDRSLGLAVVCVWETHGGKECGLAEEMRRAREEMGVHRKEIQ